MAVAIILTGGMVLLGCTGSPSTSPSSLREAKVLNRLSVVRDGVDAMDFLRHSNSCPCLLHPSEHEAVLIEGPTPGDDLAEIDGDRRRFSEPAPSSCVGSLTPEAGESEHA